MYIWLTKKIIWEIETVNLKFPWIHENQLKVYTSLYTIVFGLDLTLKLGSGLQCLVMVVDVGGG